MARPEVLCELVVTGVVVVESAADVYVGTADGPTDPLWPSGYVEGISVADDETDAGGEIVGSPLVTRELLLSSVDAVELLSKVERLSEGDDEPFTSDGSVVDEKPFRALLKYQRPSMQDSDIPHRTKLTEEIVEKANDAIRRIKEDFKVSR